MSQENVEIVRRGYEALAEQGVEAVLAFIDPQFEGTTPPSLASEPDTYRGHEGVSRFFGSFGDAMEGVYVDAPTPGDPNRGSSDTPGRPSVGERESESVLEGRNLCRCLNFSAGVRAASER